jgi:hypothetical protein
MMADRKKLLEVRGLARAIMDHQELIRDTILHEVAHALVGENHNHDEAWRAKAIELGATGETLVSISAIGFWLALGFQRVEIRKVLTRYKAVVDSSGYERRKPAGVFAAPKEKAPAATGAESENNLWGSDGRISRRAALRQGRMEWRRRRISAERCA